MRIRNFLNESLEGIAHATGSVNSKGKLFASFVEDGDTIKIWTPINQDASYWHLKVTHSDMPKTLFDLVKQKNGYWVLDAGSYYNKEENKTIFPKWIWNDKEIKKISEILKEKVILSNKFIKGNINLGRKWNA